MREYDMRLFVETKLLFTGMPYSSLDVDYRSQSVDDLLAGRTAQTLLIARELRPDCLAFSTEQSTDSRLTGQTIDVGRYRRFVDDTITAVDDALGRSPGHRDVLR